MPTCTSASTSTGCLRHATARRDALAKPVSAQIWALSRLHADAAVLLPYELSRRFGNARVHRVVLAVRGPRGGERLQWWLHADGVFDMAALRAGLVAARLDVTASGDGFTCAVAPEIVLSAAPGRVRIRTAGFDGATTAEAAAALAGRLDEDDAPLVAVLGDRYPLPRDGEATLHLRCSGAGMPRRIAAELRNLSSVLTPWAEDAEGRELLERLCASLTIRENARSCTVSLPCAFDLDAVLLVLAPSGWFR